MALTEEKHDSKTLFIRNLPYSTTSEELEKVFSDIGPLKSCFIVGDKDTGKCRGFGYAKFTLLEDAQKALKTVKKVSGRNVQMMFAKRKEKKKKFGAAKAGATEEAEGKEEETESSAAVENTDLKNASETKRRKKPTSESAVVPKKGEKQATNPYNEGKRARLIVRNLSFKCNEIKLKEAFSKYGQIVDVHIPTKVGGKKLGFGFVQFSTKAEAGMAVKGANGKPILDRKVAVDFTLPKEMFEKKATESRAKSVAAHDESKEEDMEVDEQSDEGEEIEDDEEQDDMSDDKQAKKSKRGKVKPSAVSDEDDDDSDDENNKASDDDEDDESDNDSDEDQDDESDNDSEDNEDDESDIGIDHETPSKKKRESDVAEGRTVFIRNLPFNLTEEELEEHFSTFGDIKYARIVVDRDTGMSRGTAFVQFKSQSSAEDCLRGSGNSHELGGRELSITLAVSRETALELVGKKEKPKEQKDSRNLYLVREGMLRQGTDQAKDVPAADLIRRQKIDVQKRKKLKDQDVFVSSTRLCLHNIPTSITDKQLRTIVIKEANDKKAKLIECRIMRDLDRVNTGGVAKSRGYAFCAFSEHEHALQVLRQMNNNPEIFGPNKRPIVEFSLESRKALETKQKRFEKAKLKQKQVAAKKGNNQTQKGNNPPQKGNKQPQKGNNPSQKGNNPVQSGNNPDSENKKKNKRKRKSKQELNARPLEVRKEQDKVARSLHQGSVGLPSHSGPKQRHKARSTEVNTKNKKKPAFAKKAQEPRQRESQKIPKELKQKSRRQKPDTDSFDKMVASYKKKIKLTGNFS